MTESLENADRHTEPLLDSTDIHDLDRYIGHYVDIAEGDHGMAGFVIDVVDKVEYTPEPHRVILVDYGYGFPVGADTVIIEVSAPPGATAPTVENPIDAMHQAMHEEDDSRCFIPALCPYAGRSAAALHAFRIWRMKQNDAYWIQNWVNRARDYDDISVDEIIRDARHEGAPLHILDLMRRDAERTRAAKTDG